MSELLHADIFSSSASWRQSKTLKKISDYYKTDCLLKSNEAISFCHELSEMKNKITDRKDELNNILNKLKDK
ncbi:hypothetical protein [Xenorhabdus szentirmaii]|nr:hypothetical protein [Xenorhabdus sp. M]